MRGCRRPVQRDRTGFKVRFGEKRDKLLGNHVTGDDRAPDGRGILRPCLSFFLFFDEHYLARQSPSMGFWADLDVGSSVYQCRTTIPGKGCTPRRYPARGCSSAYKKNKKVYNAVRKRSMALFDFYDIAVRPPVAKEYKTRLKQAEETDGRYAPTFKPNYGFTSLLRRLAANSATNGLCVRELAVHKEKNNAISEPAALCHPRCHSGTRVLRKMSSEALS
ncbi:hypothetical protein K488DRAFT_69670 [Vararia minispora EC-137]|uniref:Uncharacterized protein n=1 Tax=Vararia minispora EC-137 TaxID=1314806 RepID=A0ACB8QPD9_9AGAM|nr:hypothetical protein K488DRAFT_69670 [Vararia minispora EC-137]